ncbi:MAG: T9SS type A sorting domain-containing protein [Bacteroidetes bacterium]|nr:T9SS type A sorting domain-containing protein [Bacteroidota bacterium]MBT5530891.1 T9SS type A sorting domain-containing protein [Cytophagia bacterium]MBT3421249.1 T9SS type A sorting domain-containing protein [Bacteroidota bacterium]MBT3801564.1 T9SS type A sorting domain-containing protein [Bacteroidota bacterium]MBT3933057.1 T9SS type A sorting domain-containing protein [Bacteroidota bacterium]
MKKLLLLFVLAAFMANAQNVPSPKDYNGDVKNVKVFNVKDLNQDNIPQYSIVHKPAEAADYKLNASNSRYDRTLVGRSQYGLQTNSSIARRTVLYDDGKISTVFTTSPDVNPWNTRGTGYNHFDGNNWMGAIEDRLETFRSGWPNIVFFDDGASVKEYVVSHYAEAGGGSGGYSLNVNEGIGSTTWTETSKDKGSGPIWARIAQSGDFLYIIGNYSDTLVVKNGVKRPFVYSRYNIKTDTWVDDKITLPGYDDSRYAFGNGDNYAIDAKDNIVSIVVGQRINDILMWKSVDYGNSWEMIVIEDFELPVPQFLGDTNAFWYGDGSMTVIIDDNDVSHVAYGVTVGFTYDPAADHGTFWYTGTSNGIMYFNDIAVLDSAMVYDTFYKDTTVYRLWVDGAIAPMIAYMTDTSWNYKFNTIDSTVTKMAKSAITVTTYDDINNPFTPTTVTAWPAYFVYLWDTMTGLPTDSTLVIPDKVVVLDSFVVEVVDYVSGRWETFNAYTNMGVIPTAHVYDRNQSGATEIDRPTWDSDVAQGGRYGSTALVTMPHYTIDDNGNIFLIYSAPVEEAISLINGENFRDVYVVYSTNGGLAWSDPQNLSDNPEMEDVFCNVARKVDDYIHIVFQEDEEPGTEVQNQDFPTINYEFYMKIPVQDILNDVIGPGGGVGVEENTVSGATLKGIYPNPVAVETTISLDLKYTSDVQLTIYDLVGKSVFSQNFKNLSSGANYLTIQPSSLKSGAYILSIIANGENISAKLIVE